MARRIKFDVDEAAELSRSGRSLDEVAARCGVSSGTVRRRWWRFSSGGGE